MNDAFLYLKCHNKVLVHNDMAAPGLLLLQTDRQTEMELAYSKDEFRESQ